jgi:three-Cys-motif partner protein
VPLAQPTFEFQITSIYGLNLKSRTSVPNFQSDGLTITAAEPWFKVKVQLIHSYLQAFMMNASSKSDEIVFIDLFSGSGLYSMGHQKDVFPGSSLLSLTLEPPFRKWIFCEQDHEQASALEKRVKRFFPKQHVEILNLPADELIDVLRSNLPVSKAGYKVATLCLVDAFSLNMQWGIIDKLADAGVSFIMPFTFAINKRLGVKYYCQEYGDILKQLAGVFNYERLSSMENNFHFYKKLVRIYQNNFLVKGLNSAISSHTLESRLMELPAFDIGFFSKQFSAQAIQRDVHVSEHLQFELF